MECPEAALRGELAQARQQTDGLFRLISPEALYSRPVAERHRLIFYLGHFDAFDWNLLARRAHEPTRFPSGTSIALFERGIDPPPGQMPGDAVSRLAVTDEVENYNFRTRAWIDLHLDDMDPGVVQMAIEHRHMHAETFAYLMHNLPYEEKRAATAPAASDSPAPLNPLVIVSKRDATARQITGDFRLG